MTSRRSAKRPAARLFLGPCVGHTTTTTTRLWVHAPLLDGDAPIELTFELLHADTGAHLQRQDVTLAAETLGCGVAAFDDLEPDTKYRYRVLAADGEALAFPGLAPADLHFSTMPADDSPEELDFLLLSCHDPTEMPDDGFGGFRVWSALQQIRENNRIRFALFAGDQVYADHVQEPSLAEKDDRRRLKLYLDLYRKAWDDPHYRRVLASLPAYLMWDDHDITDGWGSRSDSFTTATSSELCDEWLRLFGTARRCFTHLQASRNPAPLATGPDAGFDYCFQVGRAGFAVADLRSHRNVRAHRIWSQTQFAAIRAWVASHRDRLDALFFVSPVVFTHGWPQMEEAIRRLSPVARAVTQALNAIPGARRIRWIDRLIKRNVEDIAGFRDDLEDAWASDPNARDAEQALDWLFGLQNPTDGAPPIPVVILSGDIHLGGYSMVYSYKPEHRERPVIEHICSSPVGSRPMHWLLEAVYHAQIASVPVGTSGKYWAQVSHHHTNRNVVVLSLRRPGDDQLQLKAKYYVEGKPQPEIIVSNLKRVSRAEAIDWDRPGDHAPNDAEQADEDDHDRPEGPAGEDQPAPA